MNFKNISVGKTKWLQGLAAGLIGACVALVFFLPGWLDRWEAKSWDARVQLMAAPTDTTKDIRVILLDQNSLDWGKNENGLSWPWPREVYGAVINFCKRAGVKSLAFDVLYTEPSKYGVADDEAMGEAMRGLPVSGAVFLSRTSGSDTVWPSFAPPLRGSITGLEAWMTKTGYQPFLRAVFPVPEIAAGAALLANVHLQPDADNVYRRTAVFEVFDHKPVLSLGLAAYLAVHPDAPLAIEPGRLRLDNKVIPLDDRGQAILNFRGPSGTHKIYSAASVIQSEVNFQNNEEPVILDIEDFRGKYVFFGFSAPGLYDLRPTPVSGIYPGVEIAATMLDNLLSGDFMRPVPRSVALLVTLIMALLAGLATASASGILRNAITYTLCLAGPVVLCLIAYHLGFWLPLVVQETAVAVTLVCAGLIYYSTEGRQKAFIKNAFKQYLSHDVIEQIIAHPERLKLGGERKTLSIFFSDLEGFTGISEGLDPETLTNLLNVYLSAMTDIIHEEGGTVDKYEGDAIIAFWNAPLAQPDHAVRCVRAALRCQEKLARMRPDFRQSLKRDLHMRIGINTGQAVVGNMGSHSRFDYTMIGDAVNLAARLEGINKQFGTYTMISQTTKDLLAEAFPAREISRVAVVGRREPVVVYEPMLSDGIDETIKKAMDTFSKALAFFYRGDFAGAQNLFSVIAKNDPVARAYISKCEELLARPPESWQGVWVVTTK
ncbi:MAG: adenylate/guanylate cyclase domain-containing protein [Smithellaceae bacterium]